jgi:hypothetical protein
MSALPSFGSQVAVPPRFIRVGQAPIKRRSTAMQFRSSELTNFRIQKMRYSRLGRVVSAPQVTTSTTVGAIRPVRESFPPHHLALACYVGGNKISLRFSDGFLCTVDLARFGVDTSRLRLDTSQASWGSAVEILDSRGKKFHIDSASLRAFCDPRYAAELQRAIDDLKKGIDAAPR